jgi:hypothetical protein
MRSSDELMNATGSIETDEQPRRVLRRPTTAEKERIVRTCPQETLSVPVIVAAIRSETGCSRATAYRAVSDAFAAGILEWSQP